MNQTNLQSVNHQKGDGGPLVNALNASVLNILLRNTNSIEFALFYRARVLHIPADVRNA